MDIIMQHEKDKIMKQIGEKLAKAMGKKKPNNCCLKIPFIKKIYTNYKKRKESE